MEPICITNTPELGVAIVGGIVTVASLLANIVSADSKFGKALHWLALNIKVKK